MNSAQAIICVIAVCAVITCGSLTYGYLQNDESVINSDPVPDVKPDITPTPNTVITQGRIGMAARGTCGDNLTWSLDNQGTMTIDGTGPMYNYVDNSPPWRIYIISIRDVIINEGVTTIGDRAFTSCMQLASVTIPNSVTSIGERAFYGCTFLASVTIPNSVTSIGERAFYGCGFTSVTIPNLVTSIEDHVFTACIHLSSVTIPNSVTSIGNGAFSACNQLASVTIPNSVTSIGDDAFNGCSSLESVTIPNSVTSIGEKAFQSCTSLTAINVGEGNSAYSSQGGVLFTKSKDTLIAYPIGRADSSYIIPNSVTSIRSYAFYYCTSLASVIIGNSVTSIGSYAYYLCTSLASMTIGNSVTSIGDHAFYQCTSLTSVTIPNSVTSIGDYAFDSCESLNTVYNQSSLHLVKGSEDNGCVAKYATTLVQGLATLSLQRSSVDPEYSSGPIIVQVAPGDTVTLNYTFITQESVSGTNKVTTITHTATGWTEQQ